MTWLAGGVRFQCGSVRGVLQQEQRRYTGEPGKNTEETGNFPNKYGKREYVWENAPTDLDPNFAEFFQIFFPNSSFSY